MGNVVAFSPGSGKRRNPIGAQKPFELLFFTGVRYERHDEGVDAPSAPARRARVKKSAQTGRKRRA